MASQVFINGRTFTVGADSVNVVQKGDRIFINGVEVDDDYIINGTNGPEVNIVIDGSVKKVSSSVGNIVVRGNAEKAQSTSGDVTVEGDVEGSASTVSGDIKIAGALHGKASTVSGDVRHR